MGTRFWQFTNSLKLSPRKMTLFRRECPLFCTLNFVEEVFMIFLYCVMVNFYHMHISQRTRLGSISEEGRLPSDDVESTPICDIQCSWKGQNVRRLLKVYMWFLKEK